MQICTWKAVKKQVPDHCADEQQILSWSAAIKRQSTAFIHTFTDMSDYRISRQVISLLAD